MPICKIYEDNALGKLPDARYAALDAQYAKEQDALNAESAEPEKAVTSHEPSRNYLRRETNGKQKEWEERYNAKRRAKIEAATG